MTSRATRRSEFARLPRQARERAGVRVDDEALRAAFAVLLSPLDAVDAAAWQGEVGRAMCELTGADRWAFEIPVRDKPILFSEDYTQSALDTYVERYQALDEGRARRQELGLEVWSRRLLHGPRLNEFMESEIYHDFLVPERVLDSMGITASVPGSDETATLFLHSETPGTDGFGDDGLALLHLVQPAFKAGVRDLLRFQNQRESLTAHLDTLSDPIRIVDLSGVTIHQNPSFTRTLSQRGVSDQLDAAIHDVVTSLVEFSRERSGTGRTYSGHRVTREVRGTDSEYRLHGSYLGRELLGAELRIVISLREVQPVTGLSDKTLLSRFGLTPRELEVARRVAQGDSTKEIAERCGISLHTARRHTEKIFRKLHVRSRAQVGLLLRGK